MYFLMRVLRETHNEEGKRDRKRIIKCAMIFARKKPTMILCKLQKK